MKPSRQDWGSITCMVFDLLYEGYWSLLDRPLVERRERLRQLVEDLDRSLAVFSEGIVDRGPVLFDEVCQQGLEGVGTTQLSSRYRPGKRINAWLKIKPRRLASWIAARNCSE